MKTMQGLVIVFSIFLSWGISFGLQAKVVEVIDGDTIVIDDGHERTTVRLDAVDAPELGQPFGSEAKEFLTRLLLNQVVRIERRKKKIDGMTIAMVYTSNPLSANEELLAKGYAWQDKQLASNNNLNNIEVVARSLKRGLWSDSKPIPPWEFRNKKLAARVLQN